MTKTTNMGYIAFLLVTFTLLGMSSVHASEVTGTLSSDASSNSSSDGSLSGTVSSDGQASGNISGTVSGRNGGGGGSSGSSSGGSGNRSNSDSDEQSGAVLGATSNTETPGFPNAGFASETVQPDSTLWSRMVSFFTRITSVMH